MQKIMFNDRYGLTQAVLEGRKTMTRRVIKAPRTMEGKDVYGFSVVKYPRTGVPIEVMALDADGAQINNILPKFKVGEVIAVAQSYKDTGNYPEGFIIDEFHPNIEFEAGWNNKMFVRADLMPHKIRITNVRVERLQDISEEDCIREGVIRNGGWREYNFALRGFSEWFRAPRDAFAALIDKVSGKGTWDSNPYMFVYEFELVK